MGFYTKCTSFPNDFINLYIFDAYLYFAEMDLKKSSRWIELDFLQKSDPE